MIPPPSGLIWGWFGGDSRASLGVKLAILPPCPLPPPLPTLPKTLSIEPPPYTPQMVWGVQEPDRRRGLGIGAMLAMFARRRGHVSPGLVLG